MFLVSAILKKVPTTIGSSTALCDSQIIFKGLELSKKKNLEGGHSPLP